METEQQQTSLLSEKPRRSIENPLILLPVLVVRRYIHVRSSTFRIAVHNIE